jgi:hypothetical protein
MTTDWERLGRSRTWLICTVWIPVVMTSAGALYFAHYLADKNSEIRLLRAQLAETQESLSRCMGPSPK